MSDNHMEVDRFLQSALDASAAANAVKDQESMAICAIRYTIGRRSYIVSDGQRWALEWGAKSKWVRDVIRRDLREEVRRCDDGFPSLGDPHDEAGWRIVLADLDAMEDGR